MDKIHFDLLIVLFLLFSVTMFCLLSVKLRISYPILLVIAGLVISVIPGIPAVTIDPELVFLIILPPLLFEAAWNTSWHDFWKWKRPIGLLAFGLVIFTSLMVAYLSTAMIPGFTLGLGFLLGGIISPPDAISTTSLLKKLPVPKRVLTILEGESLINDASSLIVFRFALAFIISGQFSWQGASLAFITVTGAGILIGLAIAGLVYYIPRLFPTTPSIDTSLTLIMPYIMYVTAEYFDFSGVMAVVSGGLFLSFRSHNFLGYNSRIQMTSVWSTVSFLLTGLVFILIGLQLPAIVKNLETTDSLRDAIYYGIVITLFIVILRIVCVFPAAYIPRMISKKIREREVKPSWKAVFITSWSGMRGVVSLAAALSLPLTLPNTETFPFRNLILFITFLVILFTLLIQGLSLPFIIKKLKIAEKQDGLTEEEQEMTIRLRMSRIALDCLNQRYTDHIAAHALFVRLSSYYENISALMAKKLDNVENDEKENAILPIYNLALLEVIAAQRAELARMYNSTEFEHDLLRRQETHLDLEEARIRIATVAPPR